MTLTSLRRGSAKMCALLVALILAAPFTSGCFSSSAYRISRSAAYDESTEVTAERVSDGAKVRIQKDRLDMSTAQQSSFGHVDVKGRGRSGMVIAGTLFSLLGVSLIGVAIYGGTSCRETGSCFSSELFGIGGLLSLTLGVPMLAIGVKPQDPELH